MATIKSYTDLSQSKKLAEILPLESADMKILPFTEREYRIVPINDIAVCDKEDEIYAWSLAALLDILPDRTCVYKKTYKDGRVKYQGIAEGIKELILKDNPIDACVAMIEKLNELNLL